MDTPEKFVPADKRLEKIAPPTQQIEVAIAEGLAEAMRSMRDVAAECLRNNSEKSKTFIKPTNLVITTNNTPRASVVLNGIDISGIVSSYKIEQKGGMLPTVTLEIIGSETVFAGTDLQPTIINHAALEEAAPCEDNPHTC